MLFFGNPCFVCEKFSQSSSEIPGVLSFIKVDLSKTFEYLGVKLSSESKKWL